MVHEQSAAARQTTPVIRPVPMKPSSKYGRPAPRSAPRTVSSTPRLHGPVAELPEVGVDADVEADGVALTGVDPAEELRQALQDRLAAHLSKGRPRVVLTDNVHTMVSIKRGDGVTTFRLHHMFVTSPAPVVRALARYAEARDADSTSLLRAFIDHNENRIRRRDGAASIICDVEGKYHNLQSIFDDLNHRYFAGTIRAKITWGLRGKRKRTRDSIKLGSYTFEDELIRIHPVLDAADVPRFFVEWIVYHEMLHEIHDMPVIDGRRVYHTREFRRAEAEFERYAEAVVWERGHLRELLAR